MRRLWVLIVSIMLLQGIANFSHSVHIYAQGIDRVVGESGTNGEVGTNAAQPSGGTYQYFYTQTAQAFAAGFEALDKVRTALEATKNDPKKTEKLDALAKDVQALTDLQNLYSKEFNTEQSSARPPAQAQINALNKVIGAFPNAFNSIPKFSETNAVLTGSNGQGGILKNLNNLVLQANQIRTGTISAGTVESGSLDTSNAVRNTGTSVGDVIDDPSKCSWNNFNIASCIDAGVTWLIKNTLLQLAGFLTWLTANMLNFSVQTGILQFSKWAPDSLYPIWIIIRQIVSLAVVFAGLWLGFMYIIGKEEVFGRYVAWLVVFALFVNFSYPITRVLIDISNVVSLNIYTSAVGSDPLTGANNNSAGSIIMNKLGLQGLVLSATDVKTGQAGFVKDINSTPGALIAVVFVLYAAYIFFVATAIIAARTAILVFLTVASPLLLVDSVIPKLGDAAKKMRGLYFEQLIVAPIFMIMLALTLKFMDVFQQGGPLSGVSSGTAGALTAGNVDSVKTFFGILMMLIMLHIMLKVTRSVAGQAGEFATNALGKVGGFGLAAATAGTGLLARNSLGLAAARFRDSSMLDRMQGTRTGRALYGLSNSLAQSTFDTRNIGMVSKGLAIAGVTGGLGLTMQKGSSMNYDKTFAARDEAMKKKYSSISDGEARDRYKAQMQSGVGSRAQKAFLLGTAKSDAEKTFAAVEKGEEKALRRYDSIKDEDKKRDYYETLPENLQKQIAARSTNLQSGTLAGVAQAPSEQVEENTNVGTSAATTANPGGSDTEKYNDAQYAVPATVRAANAQAMGPQRPEPTQQFANEAPTQDGGRTMSDQEIKNMQKKFNMNESWRGRRGGGESSSATVSTGPAPKAPPTGTTTTAKEAADVH